MTDAESNWRLNQYTKAEPFNRAERRTRVKRWPVGERIDIRRRALGLSYRQLAHRVGVRQEDVLRVITRSASFTEVQQYAEALGTSVDDLTRALDRWRPPSA